MRLNIDFDDRVHRMIAQKIKKIALTGDILAGFPRIKERKRAN